MTEEKYNGWTNRETWAAHLNLTSYEEMYHDVRGMSPGVLKELLQELRYAVQQRTATPIETSLILDIGSLERVNYSELSKSLANE